MLKWLKGLWQLDPPEERWDLELLALSDEEVARYKALLADHKAHEHLDWEEFREYIRSHDLPPPPPHKKRRLLTF